MRNSVIGLIVAAAAMTAIPTGTQAQWQPPLQRQEATVATGTIPGPNGGANGAPFAAASILTFTYQPVCEVRREQFVDEYGWRARDIRVCR